MTPTVPDVGSDALAWILGTDHATDFVRDVLGRCWHHARSDRRDRFAGLLSFGELDEILGTHAIRHPGVRLVRADEDIAAGEYAWRDGMVDPAAVARLFAQGATVVFGVLHDRHEGMRRLCSAVAAQVSARTQTNIYLTPPDSQGFRPHWDTHDVHVLQVEGSKRWRIYGGGPEAPLRDQKFDPKRHDPGEVEADFTLQAGEALYIPRGVMHAAVTTDEISLHVTLGVHAYTWADLLVDCISEAAERDPALRRNVPFGFARGGGEALRAGLSALAGTLGSNADLEAVVAERRRSFEEHFRPRQDDFLRAASAAERVDEGDRLRRREGTEWTLDVESDRVTLRCLGREVDLPVAAATTLEALAGGGATRAGDLDDGLDWPSRRVVLAALLREGLVTRD